MIIPFDKRLPYGAIGNAGGGSGLGAYRTLSLALGATSYWKAGEVAGAFVDIVAGNNLAANGAPTRHVLPGALSGLQDDGAVVNPLAADFESAASVAALNLGDGPFSIVLFLRRDVATAAYEIAISKGLGAYAIGFQPVAGGNRLAFINDAVSEVALGIGAVLGDSVWHQWAITRVSTGAGNTKVYKDSVDVTLLTTPAAVLANTGADLNIGRDVAAADPGFHGGIDEVALYKGIVLTPANVAALVALI
jgi:hypothetical protein